MHPTNAYRRLEINREQREGQAQQSLKVSPGFFFCLCSAGLGRCRVLCGCEPVLAHCGRCSFLLFSGTKIIGELKQRAESAVEWSGVTKPNNKTRPLAQSAFFFFFFCCLHVVHSFSHPTFFSRQFPPFPCLPSVHFSLLIPSLLLFSNLSPTPNLISQWQLGH